MNTGTYTVTSIATAPKVRVQNIASTSDPLATIPEAERWLWQNHEAMQMLSQGKEDIRAGRIYDLGSFAQFADIDIDD